MPFPTLHIPPSTLPSKPPSKTPPQNITTTLLETAKRGNALESKLALHLGGYQTRGKTLRAKIAAAAEALEQAHITLDSERTMQVAEEAVIGRRLEALRDEVSFVVRREREAQDEYRARREELESLVGS